MTTPPGGDPYAGYPGYGQYQYPDYGQYQYPGYGQYQYPGYGQYQYPGYGQYGAYGAGGGMPGPPPYPAVPNPVAGSRLASYGARVGGYLIDSVLVAVLVLLVVALLLVGSAGLSYVISPEDFYGETPPVLFIIGAILAYPAAFLSAFCYRWLPHAKSGQTPGKRLVGIKLVRLETGQPPTKGPAAGRELILIVCGMVCVLQFLDLLWPLWDEPNRQTLHDKVIRTVVVENR